MNENCLAPSPPWFAAHYILAVIPIPNPKTITQVDGGDDEAMIMMIKQL